MFGSGNSTLIIFNEEMNDIMKIIKSLDEFGLLIKDVSETIKNKTNKQKRVFFGMIIGALCASLLGDPLIGKYTIRASEGTIRAVESTNKSSKDF